MATRVAPLLSQCGKLRCCKSTWHYLCPLDVVFIYGRIVLLLRACTKQRCPLGGITATIHEQWISK